MTPSGLDPIALEVLRNRLEAIAQEVQDALVVSAYSNIIKEGHDCSAALFDCKGELIAQATALPAQLGVLTPAVRRILREFPPAQMSKGDAFILNDPYDGGTHLPDIAMVAPVMVGGRTVALAACIAHHQDVGGKTPGSLPTDSTDIFQEGLRIPPVRLYSAGAPDTVVFGFISRNVRMPAVTLGDLRAQYGALQVGAERLGALAVEHGPERLEAYTDELLDRAERLTRAALSRIRHGTYSFEDYLDDDGVEREALVRLRATVEAGPAGLKISFAGSSAQVKGPLNADRSAVMSAVYYVVKAVGDPAAPNNGGCYRPVEVDLPEGSIVNPRPPAPVNGRTITMKRITDAVFGALVQAMPGELPAAPSGMVRVMVFGGREAKTGHSYVCTDFSTGGTGGRPGRDGVDSLETDIANTMNMPAESLELDYPVRVLRNALCPDSGGAGRWRGGLGVEREIAILSGEVTLTLREDRHRTRAWGLHGGRPGALARAEIVRRSGESSAIASKGVFTLSAGDRIHCWAAGGAGYGDPLERDPHSVAADLVDGKISSHQARNEYGVVLAEDGRSVDDPQTESCRAELKEKRGPISWIYDRGEMGRHALDPASQPRMEQSNESS